MRPAHSLRGDPGARHHHADPVFVGIVAGDFAHDPPVEHHQDAVGQGRQFVKLHGNQQDRPAGRTLAHDLVMDGLLGADVDAARRLIDQQEVGAIGEFARQHDLLDVAAGSRLTASPVLARNVEALDQRLGILSDRVPVSTPLRLQALVLRPISDVCRDRRIAIDPADHTVARNMGKARLADCAARARRGLGPSAGPRAMACGPQARKHLRQFRLPIAGDAGDPHDLAGADSEAGACEGPASRRSSRAHNSSHLEHQSPCRRPRGRRSKLTSRPTIMRTSSDSC